MTYAVEVLRSAQRQLARLPAEHQERILEAVAALAQTPRPGGGGKLTGRDAWRIRVGDCRCIPEIIDGRRLVSVVVVAHRKHPSR